MGGSGVLGRSRYDLRLHLDRHQRYEIRRESPKKKAGGVLGSGAPQNPLQRSCPLYTSLPNTTFVEGFSRPRPPPGDQRPPFRTTVAANLLAGVLETVDPGLMKWSGWF